jgi:hypothetical protein
MENGEWSKEEGSRLSVERVFLCVFVSLMISAGLATLLAELGILSLVSLLAGLILTCLVLWRVERGGQKMENGGGKMENGEGDMESTSPLPVSTFRLPFSLFPLPFSLWTAGLLAVLILAAVLFFHPAEAVLVMDDAGVYVIHGLTLARTGRLDIVDPLLPSISGTKADQLLPFLRYESSYIRHGGFYIWNWWRGLIRPSFFHFPSIWMAVLALIAGPRAALWATPLAGLVAVSGFALLGRRLFGPAVGLTAALLLTLSFPQVWYARYPTSEMFMQAWLMGGLFLLTTFLRHRSRFVGVAAGIALGQIFFIRVDAWVAVLAIGVCFAGWFLKDQHESHPLARVVGDRWFLVPLGLMLVWAGLHATLFASSYVISLMHLYLTPRLGAMAVLGVAIGGAAAFLLWFQPTAITFRIPASGISRWIAGSIMAGVWTVVLVVGTRASVGVDAIRWLNWYYTPLGLAAGLIGAVLVLRHRISRPAQMILLIALMYALLYLPDPRADPTQPWGVRRFVPAVLPALTLLMAYFVARFPAPGPQRLQQAVRVTLALILVTILAQSLRPVLMLDENAGVWDELETLSRQFEPGAVVLFNQTGVGQAVGQPLTYLYDRPAFVLQDQSLDPRSIAELADQWLADGRPVYLAITGMAPWLADLDVGLKPAGVFTFHFPRLERPTTHLPRQMYTVAWPIDLYRVVAAGSRLPIHRLEMEAGELPYVRSGFYDREVTPDGTTFRWTNGAARISLPVSESVTALTLRVSGPPAGVPQRHLTLFIDDQQVGAWDLPDRFVTLSADVPAGAAQDGWLDILLRSDSWQPAEAGLGDDDRRLGVVVDWIAVSFQ